MLKQRIITALLLLPVFLAGLFATAPEGFAWFTAAVVAIAAWEWARLGGLNHQGQRLGYAALVLLVLYASRDLAPVVPLALSFAAWLAAAALVVTWPRGQRFWETRGVRLGIGVLLLQTTWMALMFLRSGDWQMAPAIDPRLLILYVFLVVWAADIGAYFAGRRWGHRKLAPAVSPGKSVEGALGGLVAVSVVSAVCGIAVGLPHAMILQLAVISLVTASLSIVGDLFESLAKRAVGLKDSSGILPGHGGVMDRIDSLTAAAPVFAFLLYLSGWIVPTVVGGQ